MNSKMNWNYSIQLNYISQLELDFDQAELELEENKLNLVFLCWCDVILFPIWSSMQPKIAYELSLCST